MILGITGVFGSGKTTIAKMFAKHGYKHVNADKLGHKLLETQPIKDMVVRKFGKKILTKGKIDRKKLKDIVFYDSNELKKLNKIIHPLIIAHAAAMSKSKEPIIVDGALLIETKCADIFDKLIVVKISKEEQLKRALKNKKYTAEEINNIIKLQLPQKEKLKYADIVIDNSKDLDHTKKQVEKIMQKLK